mmetsp:Transcript_39240/g.83790  ORF Transcript_39240/g.83790 Transcript_39240/m.83790 type:complete len:102 (+) Transcript_39240:730-1035(+)
MEQVAGVGCAGFAGRGAVGRVGGFEVAVELVSDALRSPSDEEVRTKNRPRARQKRPVDGEHRRGMEPPDDGIDAAGVQMIEEPQLKGVPLRSARLTDSNEK